MLPERGADPHRHPQAVAGVGRDAGGWRIGPRRKSRTRSSSHSKPPVARTTAPARDLAAPVRPLEPDPGHRVRPRSAGRRRGARCAGRRRGRGSPCSRAPDHARGRGPRRALGARAARHLGRQDAGAAADRRLGDAHAPAGADDAVAPLARAAWKENSSGSSDRPPPRLPARVLRVVVGEAGHQPQLQRCRVSSQSTARGRCRRTPRPARAGSSRATARPGRPAPSSRESWTPGRGRVRVVRDPRDARSTAPSSRRPGRAFSNSPTRGAGVRRAPARRTAPPRRCPGRRRRRLSHRRVGRDRIRGPRDPCRTARPGGEGGRDADPAGVGALVRVGLERVDVHDVVAHPRRGSGEHLLGHRPAEVGARRSGARRGRTPRAGSATG